MSEDFSLQAEVSNLPSSPRIHYNPNQHVLLQERQGSSALSVHEVIAESIERIMRDSRSASRRRDDDELGTEETSNTDQSLPASVIATPQSVAAAAGPLAVVAQQDSFASAASQPKSRSRSLFSSFFESKSEAEKAAVAALDGAAATQSQARTFKSTVVIVGESGSGKTTFKQCFTSSVLRSLPEVPPSMSSGSSLFYFKSQNARKDRLEVTVVDAGPLSLDSGIPQMLFVENALYIVTVNLTRVKQRGGTKRLLFGSTSGPSAIIHDQDKQNIRMHVLAIAACCSSCSIVLVGTHRDMLSDGSKDAVELVLAELQSVLTQAIEEQHAGASKRIMGCYAVSCVDHSCISPSRSGPRTIQELWTLLCDLSLKDARQLAAASSSAPSFVSGSFGPMADSFTAAANSPSLASAVTPSALAAVDVTSRLHLFLHRAKTEMNFVLLDLHTICQAAFNLGFHSRQHVLSILAELHRAGELRLLSGQPQHVGARVDSVVLLPHLITRCAAVVAKHCQTCRFPSAERAKALSFIDVEECDRADPGGHCASQGVLSPRLLVALSKSIVNWRRAVVDRAETFTLIILLSDLAFQRKTVQVPKDPVGPNSSVVFGVEYVVPSLVPFRAPLQSLEQMLSASLTLVPSGSDLVGRRLVLRRQLHVKCCPSSFFFQFLCRLAPLIGVGSSIFRDGVWIATDSYTDAPGMDSIGAFGMSRAYRAGKIRRSRGFVTFASTRAASHQHHLSDPCDAVVDVVILYASHDMQLEAVALVKHLLSLALDLLSQKYPLVRASVVNPRRVDGDRSCGATAARAWSTVSSECASQMESLFFI
jgi:hypothetical protein